MTVAILGAAGTIGRDIARALAKDRRSEIRLADARKGAVLALGRELGVDAAEVDVNDPNALRSVLRGCELAVNATWYPSNVSLMEGCLRADCDYLDLGGLYHTTLKQIDLDAQFREGGRIAMIGCGKAPGITNVLAAHGAQAFDRICAVHLRSGRRPLEKASGVRIPYSPATLLDEFTLRPVVLEDRVLREVEPLSGREVVDHGNPFGKLEYVTTLHSELATLPRNLGRGVETMSFKVALSAETVAALESLVHLGFAGREPIQVPGSRVAPRDVAIAVLSRIPAAPGREIWIVEVVLEGRSRGSRKVATLRVTGDESSNGTALAAVVVVSLRLDGTIQGTGVHPPETVIPPGPFLAGLRERGLEVTEVMKIPRGDAH